MLNKASYEQSPVELLRREGFPRAKDGGGGQREEMSKKEVSNCRISTGREWEAHASLAEGAR